MANRRLYAALSGGLLLAVVAGAGIRLAMGGSADAPVTEVNADAAALDSDGALIPATGEAASPFQSQPFFSASTPLRLADPSLLRSTSSQSRVETVTVGRPDPFASVVLPGSRVPRTEPAATLLAPTPVATAAVTAAQSLPAVPVAVTQSLPPLPQAVTLPNLPLPFLPGNVPPSPTDFAVAPTGSLGFQNLVDQVVVSGVVQVGSGVNVIVTEPGSSVSRRVAAGDMLAGGRIQVRSVDLSGQEPMVVLTYDGKDYTRTVGAPMASAL
ncbi:MAG: hypothetical protein EA368_13955 [Leptolyngbya sp. DLM2.Bin27]|nr:MAG: hypothetical protein EA368_13955 [Leptolyngbya sp. DLM2.Bin27]